MWGILRRGRSLIVSLSLTRTLRIRCQRYIALFATRLGRHILNVFPRLWRLLVIALSTLFMPAVQAGAIVLSAYRESLTYSWKVMTTRHPVRSAILGALMLSTMVAVVFNSKSLIGFDFPQSPMGAMLYVLTLYAGTSAIAVLIGKTLAIFVELHLFSKLASKDD